MNKIITLLIIFFLCILCIIPAPASATIISSDQKYIDYLGLTHPYTAANLIQYPLYVVVENTTTYTIIRLGENIILPKRTWISYNFLSDKIIPSYTISSYAQIDQLVTKVTPTSWYLTFPWSASNVKSVTNDLIDMGVFKRTTSVSVLDSNTTCSNGNCPVYQILPKVVSGDIRFYFNPQTYTNVVYPLILTENTIIVTNITTGGWTSANISLNGSMVNDDGTLSIITNHTVNDGLVGYWGVNGNTGINAYNQNNANGSVNVTNQGTLSGMNTGLNNCTGNCSGWNSSGKIGNAIAFDGVNDYVNVGSDAALNIGTGNWTVCMAIAPKQTGANNYFFGKGTSRYIYTRLNSNNYLFTRIYNGTASFDLTSSFALSTTGGYTSICIVINRSVNEIRYIINGVPNNAYSITNMGNISSTNALLFGSSELASGYFYGSMDEFRIYNRDLSNAEAATLYNNQMRRQAMPLILNQTASAGNVINRTRIVYTGQDSINNASIYARQNGTTSWNIIQANATSNTWYPITNKFNNMDFAVQLDGNGSNTPFFTSLEWDESSTPHTPVISTVTTGNFFINTTWTANVSSGIVTDSYNSTNGTTWINNTLPYRNTTLSAHAWQNLTVYAFNSTYGDMSELPLTNNTQIPNNAPTQTTIGSKSVNENSWFNFTISSTDTDNDTLTYATNATKGTLTTNTFSWLPNLADEGTYQWSFNTTDNYSAVVTETITVTVGNIDFIPSIPTIDTVTTGNFFINTTWTANVSSGIVTNSYNSTNGTTWINNTLPYRNTTLSAHAWQNLTVYAWNGSYGNISTTSLTNNTRIPNNAPVQSSIGYQSIDGGQTLSFQVVSTDLDNDNLSYLTNATHGYLNSTGYFTWLSNSTDVGTYYWIFNTTDTYSVLDTEIVTITVNETTITTTTTTGSSTGGGGSGWAIEKLNKTQKPQPIFINNTETATFIASTKDQIFYYKTKDPISLRLYDINFKSDCQSGQLSISTTYSITNISLSNQCKAYDVDTRFIVVNTDTPDTIYYKLYDILWIKESYVITDVSLDGKWLIVTVQNSGIGQFKIIKEESLYEIKQIKEMPKIILDIISVVDNDIYVRLNIIYTQLIDRLNKT